MNKADTHLTVAVLAFPPAVMVSKFAEPLLDARWQLLLALLPVIPAIAMGVLGFERMRRQDEMLRRIQLEAAAFAFAVTLSATLAYLFANAVLDLPVPAPASYILLLGASWFAGLGLGWRRYR